MRCASQDPSVTHVCDIYDGWDEDDDDDDDDDDDEEEEEEDVHGADVDDVDANCWCSSLQTVSVAVVVVAVLLLRVVLAGLVVVIIQWKIYLTLSHCLTTLLHMDPPPGYIYKIIYNIYDIFNTYTN